MATRSRSRVAWAVGGVLFGAVVLAGFVLEARLVPDTAALTEPGLGLFPSPIGRLLGQLGLPVLIIAAALAAGALPLLIGRALPAALLLASPVVLWLIFPGTDALATVLLVLALLASSTVHRALLLVLAVATHLTMAPIALLLAPLLLPGFVVWVVYVWVVPLSLLVLWVTPYDLALSVTAGGLLAALLSLLYGLGPVTLGFIWARRPLPLTVALTAAGCAVSVLLVQADDPGTVTRYSLPLVAVALLEARS